MVGAAYLVEKSCRSPNQAPANPNANDSLRFSLLFATVVADLGLVVPALIHAGFTIAYPSQPLGICINPEILNPEYFTWSRWTTACLAIMYISGAIRLLTYRELGPSFTFELAPPSKLVTTGIYAYAQHPSYVPAALVTLASAALNHNFDGWMACYLPTRVVELTSSCRNPSMLVGALIWVVVIVVRIREEEAMLKKVFGAEWETWHRKTARLIPGVF
jgi:protein-S-isoprenylcysteine O-methyltransferase Ste14